MKCKEVIVEGKEDKIRYLSSSKNLAAKILSAAKKDRSAKVSDGPETEDDRKQVEEILNAISQADPTEEGRSLVWLARMYSIGQFLLEDINRVKRDLEKFYKYKNTLSNKDLNSYKSLDQLYDVLDEIDDEQEQVSKKETSKKIKQEGAKTIINTPDVKVIQLLTKEAACYYGKGTRWCTTSPESSYFDSYTKEGPIYVIIAKIDGKQRKFQLHLPSDQYMNERDQAVSQADIKKLSELEGYTKFLNMLIQKEYGQYFK